MTTDQKNRISKFNSRLKRRILLAIGLYMGWLFFMNFAVVLFVNLYEIEKSFGLFLYMLNTYIFILGLRNTVEGHVEQYREDVKVVMEIKQ